MFERITKKHQKKYEHLLKTIHNEEEFVDTVMKDKDLETSSDDSKPSSIKKLYESTLRQKQMILEKIPNKNGFRYNQLLNILDNVAEKLVSMNLIEGGEQKRRTMLMADFEFYIFFNNFKKYLEDYDLCPDRRHMLKGL